MASGDYENIATLIGDLKLKAVLQSEIERHCLPDSGDPSPSTREAMNVKRNVAGGNIRLRIVRYLTDKILTEEYATTSSVFGNIFEDTIREFSYSCDLFSGETWYFNAFEIVNNSATCAQITSIINNTVQRHVSCVVTEADVPDINLPHNEFIRELQVLKKKLRKAFEKLFDARSSVREKVKRKASHSDSASGPSSQDISTTVTPRTSPPPTRRINLSGCTSGAAALLMATGQLASGSLDEGMDDESVIQNLKD